MKIQDACENKGTLPEFPNMYCLIVRHTDDTLSPCWYDAKTDHFAREVTGKEVLRIDWHIFPEVKEIRPENAGELWIAGGIKYMSQKVGDRLRMIPEEYSMNVLEPSGLEYFIHGTGQYERLFPPVEEDVERIEIEGVEWKQIQNQTIVFPKGRACWLSLTHKPPMKMILEIPKI